MAMFNGANNVVVHGGSFVANASSLPKGSLNKLADEVAPNAILNAGGRADEVRCFPGTREEVIGKLEKFMGDNRADKKRMMWLSGPAGAGKSAICQTVAERLGEQGRQSANFFFFRGDRTRSHSRPLVATLVYQLCRIYPDLNEPVFDCLETDPLVCSSPIEAQFKQLLASPIQTIQQSTPIQQKIVIIVDGLDECNDKGDQDRILVALHRLSYADNSPFLILVSSRAEPHLVMSFNRLGSSVKSIFLNDDYKPQKDIRRFVVAKFAEIKKHHHLAWTLSKTWPVDLDIDTITTKSSGQFIYAATVMRFIQFSSESPALSLVTVLEMPTSTDHSPLVHLDAVYSYTFSKVRNIRTVKLVLFARHCSKPNSGAVGPVAPNPSLFEDMLRLVGYKHVQVQSFFADLVAVIKVVPRSNSGLLEFYHASLDDYLNDKSRSTIHYPYDNETAAGLSSMYLRNIENIDSHQFLLFPLRRVERPTPELSESLLNASTKRLNSQRQALVLAYLISHIERLYWEQDKDQFKVLLQSWSRFVYVNKTQQSIWSAIRPKDMSASHYYEQYWMTEDYHSQEPLTSPSSPSAGVARSNTQITSARASLNAATSDFDRGLDVSNVRVSMGNTPSDPPKTSTPPKSNGGGSSRHKATHLQPGGISNNGEGEAEHGSRGYGDGPYEFVMIRVKLHYQGDIRSMAITPDTPFSQFVDKVTSKFGKNLSDLIMKFKDVDGDVITLCDDSDFEHAIETAQESSNGKGKGKLDIWCEDSAREPES